MLPDSERVSPQHRSELLLRAEHALCASKPERPSSSAACSSRQVRLQFCHWFCSRVQWNLGRSENYHSVDCLA